MCVFDKLDVIFVSGSILFYIGKHIYSICYAIYGCLLCKNFQFFNIMLFPLIAVLIVALIIYVYYTSRRFGVNEVTSMVECKIAQELKDKTLSDGDKDLIMTLSRKQTMKFFSTVARNSGVYRLTKKEAALLSGQIAARILGKPTEVDTQKMVLSEVGKQIAKGTRNTAGVPGVVLSEAESLEVATHNVLSAVLTIPADLPGELEKKSTFEANAKGESLKRESMSLRGDIAELEDAINEGQRTLARLEDSFMTMKKAQGGTEIMLENMEDERENMTADITRKETARSASISRLQAVENELKKVAPSMNLSINDATGLRPALRKTDDNAYTYEIRTMHQLIMSNLRKVMANTRDKVCQASEKNMQDAIEILRDVSLRAESAGIPQGACRSLPRSTVLMLEYVASDPSIYSGVFAANWEDHEMPSLSKDKSVYRVKSGGSYSYYSVQGLKTIEDVAFQGIMQTAEEHAQSADFRRLREGIKERRVYLYHVFLKEFGEDAAKKIVANNRYLTFVAAVALLALNSECKIQEIIFENLIKQLCLRAPGKGWSPLETEGGVLNDSLTWEDDDIAQQVVPAYNKDNPLPEELNVSLKDVVGDTPEPAKVQDLTQVSNVGEVAVN
jgi:hypothetical protein